MHVERYLERLSYTGPRDVCIDTLRGLHRAHLMAVPFENLSIHHGEPIQLDEAWLFDKIVHRRRGGFCYELNGLFCALLRQLGFQVDQLAARVFDRDGDEGIDFDHMTLRVDLDQPWLADVGFGDCFIEPLPLQTETTWTGVRRSYQLLQSSERIILQERHGQEWKSQYVFTTCSWQLSDFQAGCTYHQTSPDSPFSKRRICSRLTEQGRVSLTDRRHIVTHADDTKTETVIDDEEFATALSRDFGIEPISNRL